MASIAERRAAREAEAKRTGIAQEKIRDPEDWLNPNEISEKEREEAQARAAARRKDARVIAAKKGYVTSKIHSKKRDKPAPKQEETLRREATLAPNLPAQEGEYLPVQARGSGARRWKDLPKKAGISESVWRHLIGMVADGVCVVDAVRHAGVVKAKLEGTLRTEPKMRAQWEDAKTAAYWKYWDIEILEKIMVSIAMGITVEKAVKEHYVFPVGKTKNIKNAVTKFYTLMFRDPMVKEMYDEARMVQAEKMAIDDLIEISDDRSNDETLDGKPNSAAVNRDRLRVHAREWAAGKLHYKRFGEKIQQDVSGTVVIDHAVRLEDARRRKEAAYKEAKDITSKENTE